MDVPNLTYYAIGLKVGLSLLAVAILAIVIPIRRRRARARQAIEDDAIIHPPSRPSKPG